MATRLLHWLISGSFWVLSGVPAFAFNQEFATAATPSRPGHATLMARAALDTPWQKDTLALIQAQWEVDFPGVRGPQALDQPPGLNPAELIIGFVAGYMPDDQPKHFLRWWTGLPRWRSQTRSMAEDYQAGIAYFRGELETARYSPPDQELRHLGHALHTLQDSYSPAHTERDALGVIHAMRYCPDPDDGGHQYPADARDWVADENGTILPPALHAITACHVLMLEYAAARKSDRPAFEAFLDGFVRRYLYFENPAQYESVRGAV